MNYGLLLVTWLCPVVAALAAPGALRAERTGNDIRLAFPTVAGKHYRVDHKTNLTDTAWSVFAASVNGRGSQMTMTNTGVTASSATGFYRVARTD